MSYTRLENLDARQLDTLPTDIQRQYFKIEVVILPVEGLSLSEWVHKQNTTSYPLPKVLEQHDIKVAGQPAIYQVEQFGTFVHPVVFIKKDEHIYLLNISSGGDEHKPTIDTFLKQFTFTL